MNGAPALAGSWIVDAAQSRMAWSIRHLGVSVVEGTFGEFGGRLTDGRATGSIVAASICSDDPRRDEYVRSKDMLDADAFPELRFVADLSLAETTSLTGELTIRDTTLPLTLAVERTDPEGGDVGLRLSGTVLRRDYGMRFPQALGAADRSVSNEVGIAVDLVLEPAS